MTRNSGIYEVIIGVLHNAMHLSHRTWLVKEFTMIEIHKFHVKGIFELNKQNIAGFLFEFTQEMRHIVPDIKFKLRNMMFFFVRYDVD